MKKGLFLVILAMAVALTITSCFLKPETPQSTTEPQVEATIVDISLTGAKIDFDFGESFSFEDLVVTATMSDDSERVLQSTEYTVTSEDFDCMKVGTYQASVSVTGTNISKSYSVTVKQADRLKVLMIGNSYADDTINYAYEIARSAGVPADNILIADIYIGSCSIDTHWANAQSDAPAYRFGLEKEGYFDGNSYQNWTMKRAIEYANWDFIVLQQNSGNSGISSSYSNLQNLMDYVLSVATNPNVKLIWHQTWAYAQNSPNEGFSAYNNDQMAMYDAIQSALKQNVLNKEFAAIIPNGTAVQNARTSVIGDNLTRDQWDHLSESAGRYIAAMGLVGTLTGRDMSKVEWKPTDSNFAFSMTDEMILICKESCANAKASPYEVTYSEYRAASIFDVFEGKGTKNDPYLIQSAEDLWKLSELTAGQSCGDKNTFFKLTNDIDLGADSWRPICSSAEIGWVGVANSFNANFDGNGKTITFVGSYTGDAWAKGLFSAVGGYVHDLTLRGTITIEMGRVGALASMAMAGARIENVTSYVNITAGNAQVGGIVGYIEMDNVTITNCANYGSIQGRNLVGGIVGGSWKSVTYIGCENHGDVTATANRAGGIVGEKYPSATLTDCSNTGTVKAGDVVATTDAGVAESYAGNLIGQEFTN